MRGYLNNLAGFFAITLMAALPLCAVHAADVQGARVWAGAEYTRLVLDVDGVPKYQIKQGSGEVVVTLGHSQVARGFKAPAADGLYQGLQHSSRGQTLQLTAKVPQNSQLKSFLLKPAKGDKYRLVLDIYPDGDNSARLAKADTGTKKAVIPVHNSRRSAMNAAAMLGGERKVVVAIDAGHGGKDPGAHGPHGTLEKNVTLAVARDLAAQINRQPGMKAVLTRDSDYFIPLKRRYQIARQHNADLFVSIHADSFVGGDAKGSSVWVLSSRGKTSEAARWLADRENRADLIGGVALDDKNDGLAKVLLDMQQGYAIQASDAIAKNVLEALGQLGPTHRGYVEHANFVVLRSPDVPSILVETAFISNPREELRLRDPAHQKLLAKAVMGGVKNYFEATPPPGTWFAAQAARRNGTELAATSSGGSAAVAGGERHKVNRGESLSSIARQYGISVGALKDANSMNGNTVRAGSVLTIPTG